MIITDMLPELLFSVGNSMQDFSKEEFGLIGGPVGVNGDKDLTNHNNNNVNDIKLAQTPDLIESTVAIKLDEASDLYQWNTSNIGCKLLKSSDDPLISGGTNDNQNDNELSSVVANAKTSSICLSSNKIKHSAKLLSPDLSPPTKTNTTSSTNKKNSGRPRRKGQFKLRFHHQALPPEYLDHYEATQNNLQKKEAQLQQQQQSKQTKMEIAGTNRDERANESVRSWLQKILELQKEGVSLAPIKDDLDLSTITPIITEENRPSQSGVPASTIKSSKVVSYKDLPYMGEMTLENSKPRRGRKPKKADICHLIYKNYGTILPGTPKSIEEHKMESLSSKTLLEKRLTSNNAEETVKSRKSRSKSVPTNDEKMECEVKLRFDEPLNLCVRDTGGDYSVTVSSTDDESDDVFDSSCATTPIITPSDIMTDNSLATNLKMSLPNFQTAMMDGTVHQETPLLHTLDGFRNCYAETPPGYVYWPSAGVFIHPMALYYQKMVDASTSQAVPVTTSSSGSTIPTTATVQSNLTTETTKKDPPKILIPKNISQLMKPEKSPVPSTSSPDSNKNPSPQSSTKRKRSAIFIPPVPAENSSNPATEVSICKFKFTGGAKPCLQEKKMLSVDSGGNFRYYSGTGDKSMRGYEFFPRESLQQSSLTSNSTTGAFLNTPSEKILVDIPPPSLGLSNDLLQIPDFPSPTSVGPSGTSQTGTHHHRDISDRRKRKSRRSIQRENLEKTFKEKGFLIQTQQLQSAEGATYCKFRQLRKFTRYLFRSWKDYLPGELQQNQQGIPQFEENSMIPPSPGLNRLSPTSPMHQIHVAPEHGRQNL